MNRFFENIQKTIENIPENLKQNYINYEVSKLFKLVNSNYVNTFLNYFFRPCIYAVSLIILGSCGGGGGGGGGNSSCSEFLLPQSQNK
mgnify:CR=1 FL=1